MSFTDDQLLNLVNNTVLTKSEFDINDFTGGGVQITSTHNHKIIKHKIYLTFGYDDKRNSRSYSEDIEEDISVIWQSAIQLKVKSLQASNIGSSLSDLNKLMNTDIKIEDRDIEIIDSDKQCNDIVTTSLRTTKEKKLSLINQIEEKLNNFPTINRNAFYEWMEYKKYKAIGAVTKVLNFLNEYDFDTQQKIVDTSIMNNYKGLFEPKQSTQHTQSFKQQDEAISRNKVDSFLDSGYSLRDSLDVQDVEVITYDN